MARSPENAKAKNAVAEEMVHPVAEAPKGRLLKAPDGFVYTWTEPLAAQPGFVEYSGEVNAAGFAAE